MKNLTSLFVLSLLSFFNSRAQTPCVDGYAGEFPCNQITLMGHLSPSELKAVFHNGYYLNDIWGWTDPETSKEYALVGLKNGVAFVDISTPTAPKLVGNLAEPVTSNGRIGDIAHEKSTWRDIKVYKNYAFVVSDLNGQHGMQVFDLTKLRNSDNSEPQEFTHDAHYTEFGSAHNIVINEATGFAYAVGISSGGEICEGGLHIMDINDPLNPQFVGCFDADGYTHDAQCVIYEGPDTDYNGKEICFNSNVDALTIVNLDNKSNPEMISSTGYSNWHYTHQGWLSEDHRFFLQNDELDEMSNGHNPKTLIWNIEDLDLPVLIGVYYNNEPAIDHNLYTHKNMVFESNYFSGLRVMSLDQIENGMLREIAFFDTYPQENAIEFGGTWSNYPYFPSGTIVVSDMNNGLFILKLDIQEDIITDHPQNWSGCNGETAVYEIETAQSNVIYQWQYFNGKDYLNLTDGNEISGSSTPKLTIKSSSQRAKQLFRCGMKDHAGHLYYSYTATMSFDSDSRFPEADFSFLINNEGQLSITNKSKYAKAFHWLVNSKLESEEENPTLDLGIGDFEISLIAINDCGADTLTEQIQIVTGLTDLKSSLKIYPNPASDFIQIQTETSGHMVIYDATGKVQDQFDIESGLNELDICGLKSGIHFFHLISEKSIKIQKVVVE